MIARVTLRDQAADCWLSLEDPREVLVASTLDEVVAVIRAAECLARDRGLHVAGFLSFEAAPALDPTLATRPPGWLPLAWFAGFARARKVAAPTIAAPPPTLHWQASLDEAAYHRALGQIRQLIAAGDTYQVNFSYRLRTQLDAEQAARLDWLFAGMTARQQQGLGAFIETADWAICCASHELFFERHGNRISSRPMKGTVARGADAAEDQARADWLAGSPKNRAENLMITDMVRNDLGRIARTGSVQTKALFDLERYPTLWQMTSTVTAETALDLSGILQALFPAASITGAPKRRTMDIIRAIETDPRQIYTGTIGYLRPGGNAQFNVAIRTTLVNKRTGSAEYGVGGGIVWDSDAAEEFAESRTKALIIGPPTPVFSLLETLLWTPTRGFERVDGHLARLARSAEYFGYPLDRARVARALADAAATFPPHNRRVRLLIDADGRPSVTHANLIPLPSDYRVALAPKALPVEHDPFARNKTTHRVIYEQARALAPAADDVLLWNTRGELTESTIANLVVELDGVLVTPPVFCGLLPGIFRQQLIDTGAVQERIVRIEDLARCTSISLVNSLRGRWPVRVIEVEAAGAPRTKDP